METRKVQRVSSGTLTVSLPKAWATGEGIEVGTVVNLHTHLDGVLVIQARERDVDDTRRVAVPPADAAPLETLLRAAYTAGVGEVVLEADDEFDDDQRRTIERVARSLAGVTVAETTPERVTVRTLLDSSHVSVRQSVRQLRFVAVSTHRDATAALVGDAPVEALVDRDEEADRLFALVDRHLSRGLERLDEVDALGLDRVELFELRATAHELARVAAHAERIAALAADLDGSTTAPIAEEFTTLARTARDAVDDAVHAVLGDAGPDGAYRALAARDRVHDGVETLDRRLFESAEGDYRLTRALDSLRVTADHAAAIAELGLRAAVRRGDADAEALDAVEDGAHAGTGAGG